MEIPRNCFRMSIIASCNMKCSYCHNEGNTKKDMLTKEEIERIVRNSRGFGLKAIRLTGGEPLIHPQIMEICEMLSQKYGLEVGINTNCIQVKKLEEMVKKGWIKRIVVGLDYFDNLISKDSPIGISSKIILENIIKLRNLGCDISISTVYVKDKKNKLDMIRWAIKNEIRIKVLEVVKNEKEKKTSEDFIQLQKEVQKTFGLELKKDEYKEVTGYLNGKKVITFFHSHCRIRECDICKQIHLRITASGKMKQCMYTEEDDIDVKAKDFREKLAQYIVTPAKYY